MSQPRPVIPLEYAPPADTRLARWRAAVWVLIGLGVACCVAGSVAIAAIEVESVLVTGPILFLIGVGLRVGGSVTENRRAVALGAGHCGVCGLFVALVNVLDWGPSEALVPFAIMGVAYTLVSTVVALAGWRSGRGAG